jgi:hypothetical protein
MLSFGLACIESDIAQWDINIACLATSLQDIGFLALIESADIPIHLLPIDI